jgi:hypothetical protein
MQCVKCEIGEFKKIIFTKTGQVAHICDYCSTFWVDGELIKYNTGHSLDPYNRGDDYEYAVSEIDKVDEDHQAVHEIRIL